MKQFTVYVTPSEFDDIASIVIGRDELFEAMEVCRILGLPFDKFASATLYFKVVPFLKQRITVRRIPFAPSDA